jgi:Deacetylases, including yeast histone deacetylase and acetoin utilization protein
MKTKIIYSEKCLEYGGITGPEKRGTDFDGRANFKNKKYEFIEPVAAGDEEISRAHAKEYIEAVENGAVDDPDTPAYDNIRQYARLAAGAAIAAAKTNGFSLMRPPGHHCGVNGKALGAVTRGFCYFNNIAIAVKKWLKNHNH